VITLNDTQTQTHTHTHSVGPHQTRDRIGFYLYKIQYLNETNINAPAGIQARKPSKREVVEIHLGPDGTGID